MVYIKKIKKNVAGNSIMEVVSLPHSLAFLLLLNLSINKNTWRSQCATTGGSEGSVTSDLPRRAALLFRIALNFDACKKAPAWLLQPAREGTPRVKTRALHCYRVSVPRQHQEAANRGLNLRRPGDFPVVQRIPAVPLESGIREMRNEIPLVLIGQLRPGAELVLQHWGGPTVLVNIERAAFAPSPGTSPSCPIALSVESKNQLHKEKIGYKVRCHEKK